VSIGVLGFSTPVAILSRVSNLVSRLGMRGEFINERCLNKGFLPRLDLPLGSFGIFLAISEVLPEYKSLFS
jgi:hypothetical protein